MALDCAEALLLTYMDRGHEIADEGGRAEIATIEVDLDELRKRLEAEKMAVRA